MKSYIETDHPAALALIKGFVENGIEQLGHSVECYDYRVDDVESESRDGFIPYTEGGYDGIAYVGFHSGGTYSVKHFESLLDKDYEWCMEEFRREHDLADDADVDEHPEWEEFHQEWEYNDEDVWFLKLRALIYDSDNRRNESGQDEVLLCMGINDDFNYGRDSIGWCPGVGTKWLWERTIPLAEVTPELLAECREEFWKVWETA